MRTASPSAPVVYSVLTAYATALPEWREFSSPDVLAVTSVTQTHRPSIRPRKSFSSSVANIILARSLQVCSPESRSPSFRYVLVSVLSAKPDHQI